MTQPAVQALLEELAGRGVRVSVDAAIRQAASTDYSHLSPLLPARLPSTPADAVAFPCNPEQVAIILRAGCCHRVPVTPRGQGTGNYGQAVPLHGGLVLDLSGCTEILQVGDGWIQAQAGASFVALEAAAGQHDQELAIMPTTTGSTIGGFLAGGAGGIGSIQHGWIWDGYVHALEVMPCTPDGEIMKVEGVACRPMLHAYGVSGIITTATVALAPARDWTTLLASFTTPAAALQAGRELLEAAPLPRLMSIDEPGVVATYPADPAIPHGRHSLRAIVDQSVLRAASAAVTGHGGIVEATGRKPAYLGSLAFNHVTLRARKARPELCHLQVSGQALIDQRDAVGEVFPGALLHLDAFAPGGGAGRSFAGLLLVPFTSTEALYVGMKRLRELGVFVVDPHTWLLHDNLDQIRMTARSLDPQGLLNPGKLPVE